MFSLIVEKEKNGKIIYRNKAFHNVSVGYQKAVN